MFRSLISPPPEWRRRKRSSTRSEQPRERAPLATSARAPSSKDLLTRTSIRDAERAGRNGSVGHAGRYGRSPSPPRDRWRRARRSRRTTRSTSRSRGLLTVTKANGEVGYTPPPAKMDATGLVTNDGPRSSRRSTSRTDATAVTIASDGTISATTAAGRSTVQLGQLQIAMFPEPERPRATPQLRARRRPPRADHRRPGHGRPRLAPPGRARRLQRRDGRGDGRPHPHAARGRDQLEGHQRRDDMSATPPSSLRSCDDEDLRCSPHRRCASANAAKALTPADTRRVEVSGRGPHEGTSSVPARSTSTRPTPPIGTTRMIEKADIENTVRGREAARRQRRTTRASPQDAPPRERRRQRR